MHEAGVVPPRRHVAPPELLLVRPLLLHELGPCLDKDLVPLSQRHLSAAKQVGRVLLPLELSLGKRCVKGAVGASVVWLDKNKGCVKRRTLISRKTRKQHSPQNIENVSPTRKCMYLRPNGGVGREAKDDDVVVL